MTQVDPSDDEYETEDQAVARIRNAAGLVVVEVPVVDDGETITEYSAWNQAEFFDPLFASGEIHSALRHMVDDPLFTSNNLRSAVRFMDMRNHERALADQLGKYGPVVVRVQTIVRSPHTEVSYEQVDRARGR